MPRQRFLLKVMLIVTAMLLIVAVYVARVAWVNSAYPKATVVTSKENTWVALNGSFIEEAGQDQEQTDGYSIKVDSAQLMTHDEYLSNYARDNTDVKSNGRQERSVAVLTLEIKNDSNQQGLIYVGGFKLVVPAKTDYLLPDIYFNGLWTYAEPNASPQVSIKPHTTYTIELPFIVSTDTEQSYDTELLKGDYQLVLSEQPIKNIVDIVIS